MSEQYSEDGWARSTVDSIFSEIPLEPDATTVEQQILRDTLYGSDGIRLTGNTLIDFSIRSTANDQASYRHMFSTPIGSLCIDPTEPNPDGFPEFVFVAGTLYLMPSPETPEQTDFVDVDKLRIQIDAIKELRGSAREGFFNATTPFVLVPEYIGVGGRLITLPTLSIEEITIYQHNGHLLSPSDVQRVQIQYGDEKIQRFIPAAYNAETCTIQEVTAHFTDGTWKQATPASASRF